MARKAIKAGKKKTRIKAKVGDVRVWGNGKKMKKQSDGSWKPVKASEKKKGIAKLSLPKNSKNSKKTKMDKMTTEISAKVRGKRNVTKVKLSSEEAYKRELKRKANKDAKRMRDTEKMVDFITRQVGSKTKLNTPKNSKRK